MRQIRVALADEDVMFRGALVDVLTADGRFEVVAVAATGEGLLRAVGAMTPDLVLIAPDLSGGGADIVRCVFRLGGRSGHRTGRVAAWRARSSVGEARGRARLPRVVALSGPRVEVPDVLDMLRAGATGYVAKGLVGGGEVADLLVRCAAGEVVLAVPGGADVLQHLLGAAT